MHEDMLKANAAENGFKRHTLQPLLAASKKKNLRKERKTVSDDKKLIEVQHLQQYFSAGGRGKKRKKYVQAVDDVSFYIKKAKLSGSSANPVAVKPQ